MPTTRDSWSTSRPIQAVATSRPDADAGLFQLRFDDERYLPFEGAGAISTWRIELRQADNAIDLSQLTDVVLTLAYTARNGGAALEAVGARRARERAGTRRHQARAAALREPQARRARLPGRSSRRPPPGQEVEVPLPLEAESLLGPLSRSRSARSSASRRSRHARGQAGADALKLRLDPPKGSGTEIAGWAPPWPQSRMLRAGGEASGPAGAWKLAVSATGAKVPDLVDDLVLVFELRARKS